MGPLYGWGGTDSSVLCHQNETVYFWSLSPKEIFKAI